MTDDDRRLLLFGNSVMVTLWGRLQSTDATPEDLWLVLAIAARLAERALLHTHKRFGTDGDHAATQARLAELLLLCDLQSDAIDETTNAQRTRGQS